jgi:hypothetical protein
MITLDQITRGLRDENKLTDSVFYDRHPEWKGKWLRYGPPNLKHEWMQIRDTVVRPLLKRPLEPRPLGGTTTQPSARQQSQTQRLSSPVLRSFPNIKVQASTDWLQFDNIRKYRPDLYPGAISAQIKFQGVKWFRPWYQKISIAVEGVSISESEYGIGKLVFSMNRQYLMNLVEDEGLRDKIIEMTASSVLQLAFSEEVIEALGLGLTLLELARGIENERMLGRVGADADKWRYNKRLDFTFGIVAEDLSRRNWGDGYFFSRNVPDLKSELASRFAEFQQRFYELGHYTSLEQNLAKYQGNIPDFVPPEPPHMSAR